MDGEAKATMKQKLILSRLRAWRTLTKKERLHQRESAIDQDKNQLDLVGTKNLTLLRFTVFVFKVSHRNAQETSYSSSTEPSHIALNKSFLWIHNFYGTHLRCWALTHHYHAINRGCGFQSVCHSNYGAALEYPLSTSASLSRPNELVISSSGRTFADGESHGQ